jgi:hypothetical protein
MSKDTPDKIRFAWLFVSFLVSGATFGASKRRMLLEGKNMSG